MPLLPDYIDSEVANLATFSVYEQKDLDLEITWTVDENIDLTLYASIGASPANYSVNAVNDYVIARN